MKPSRCLLVALVSLAVLGCGRPSQESPQSPAPQPGAQAPQLSPDAAADARRKIVAWLECEECESGELEAVVKLGETAVPTLSATLRDGPSPAARERLRLHLVETYRQLKTQAATRAEAKVDMTEEQYVKTYMDNYVALYRVRSAQALAAIGGPRARQALETAKGYDLRPDVRDAVNASLQKVSRP